MKKTAISLLLALAMVFSLVLVAAPQAQAAAHTDHCVCGGNANANGVGGHTCATATNWVDLNATDIITTATLGTANETTNYYLSADLEIYWRLMIAANATVNICLNGFTISTTVTDGNGRIILLNENSEGATVNVCDCKGGGAMTSPATTNGVAFYMSGENTTLNVFGGTFPGNGLTCEARGGIVYMSKASQTFNMYGGKIMGGQSNDRGGNVMVKGTMNMYGGEITGGIIDRIKVLDGKGGGNIHVAADSVLNLYGGSITGGTLDGEHPDWTCDIYVLKGAILNVKNMDASTTLYVQEGGVVNTEGMHSSLALGGTGTNRTLTKAGVNPGTGDSANLAVMGLGLVLGVAGMACLLPKKQKV